MDDRDPQPTNNSHPNAPQNDDDDMYFGAPQAQGVEFGSSGAANQGPDLSLSFGDDTGSDFATMFPLTHEDQMQGAGETSAPSWSNGPYYHNNPDPTTILNSLVLPGLFPSQPAYDRAPGMPDSIEPRLLRMSSLNHDVLPPLTSTPTFPLSFTKRGVGHFSEQPHNQNPAPSQTLPQDTLYDHRPTISDNNQGPSTSHSGSGRQTGSSKSRSRAGRLTQLQPGSERQLPVPESRTGQQDAPQGSQNKFFIPVNASGKRAATEPGKRTSKKAKSAAQKPSQPMVQPSTALPVQLIHPPYQKMPNPVQVFLLVQAGAGNYPLGVSVEHLYDNFTAYATIKDFNVQHVTKDTFQQVQRVIDFNIMNRAIYIARHYYGNPKPNHLASVRKWSAKTMVGELHIHSPDEQALKKAAFYFNTEQTDLLNEFSADGGSVDLRPNKDAPGFETKAIIHFANPIFIEACQEILMLFPPEALKYLQRSPGILITVAAALSTGLQRLCRGRITWDPLFDILGMDEELFGDIRYFLDKTVTLRDQVHNIDTDRTRGEKHSLSEIVLEVFAGVEMAVRDEDPDKLAKLKSIQSAQYRPSHTYGHFLRKPLASEAEDELIA